MVIATLALVGFFVALYLWLWKLGLVGSLACGPGGGCETVQTSPHAEFLGLPVALYGVAGYAALFAVSVAGLHPRWAERREPAWLLVLLSLMGLGFTAYLTYLEAFVIHAWCRWCLVSAGLIAAIFVTALSELASRRTPAPRAGR